MYYIYQYLIFPLSLRLNGMTFVHSNIDGTFLLSQ